MNQLNSVLIEGDLTSDPTLIEGTTVFSILSYRKDPDTNEESAVTVTAQATGRLGKSCLETLKAGRGVRVVGRLSGTMLGLPLISAEHVEYKPVLKGSPEEAGKSDESEEKEVDSSSKAE